MKIFIIIEEDNGKRYSRGFVVAKKLTNEKIGENFSGQSDMCKLLYKLLLSMGRTLQLKFNFPFFVDLHTRMDGSITGCSFVVDKERFDELVKLRNQP